MTAISPDEALGLEAPKAESLVSLDKAFWAVHLAVPVAIYFVGISWWAVLACLTAYYVRMFAITAGYHRYFSHRSFKTGRFFQLVLAVLGASAVQKGVLWWAAHHRAHHRHSDTEEDLHSPSQRGFWWAHVGWILDEKYNDTDWNRIQDFAKYPELRWLNKYHFVPGILAMAIIYAIAGAQIFVWASLVSTVLLWHGTFTINSLAHVFGKRVYETSDTSRNSFLLALITLGEGWHNNHHYYQASANQGFRWWEIDISFYILVMLEKVGIVWDVKRAPDHVVRGERIAGRTALVAADVEVAAAESAEVETTGSAAVISAPLTEAEAIAA